MKPLEPMPKEYNKVYLEIANLKICFSAEQKLSQLVAKRYAGFSSDSANINLTIQEKVVLNSTFGEGQYVPEIRHLEDGFEIDQAPFFFIRYDRIKQSGTLEFTQFARELPPGFLEDDSPLAFGLRRGIGVLFVTLLAQDGAPGFHATGLNVDGYGIIAPGDSGTGKSTFFAMFPESMQLNDEYVVVRNTESGPLIFSTPFSETWDKDRQNRSAQLRLLLKLTQSPDINSQILEIQDVMRILNHNILLPVGAEREYKANFDVLLSICHGIQGQELCFNLDSHAVVSKVHLLTNDLNIGGEKP